MAMTHDDHDAKSQDFLTVIYDGECPFCASYVRLSRLREQFEHVQLISAREKNNTVTMLVAKGYNLDEGMVVIQGHDIYYGADAMAHLALLSTRSDLFNSAVRYAVAGKTRSRLLYPLFKAVRKASLFFLGRKPIKH